MCLCGHVFLVVGDDERGDTDRTRVRDSPHMSQETPSPPSPETVTYCYAIHRPSTGPRGNDDSAWARGGVLHSVVFCGGMGGVSKGSIGRCDGKYAITALVIECGPEVCQTHRLNNPSVPVLQLRIVNANETKYTDSHFLPRSHWRRAWFHSSNSCKKASTANTNPNPQVRKSGAVAKAVLASMVLEEEGPIRAARGEDSRDIRRGNHPAKGPAPPGSMFFSVPVGFM